MPRILVVEDSVEMGNFIARTLGKTYSTAVAPTGMAALEMLPDFQPDLVVTDVMMPGMSGDELVREIRLRQEFDEVPVLMITAKSDDRLRARMLREGAQDYISKPVPTEELRARVATWISVRRTRQVLQQELSSRELRIEELAQSLAERSREMEVALGAAQAARAEAEKASRTKSAFLGVMSHELRTPLNAVVGYTDLLELEIDGPVTEGQKRSLQRIRDSAQELLVQIQELLTVARDGEPEEELS